MRQGGGGQGDVPRGQCIVDSLSYSPLPCPIPTALPHPPLPCATPHCPAPSPPPPALPQAPTALPHPPLPCPKFLLPCPILYPLGQGGGGWDKHATWPLTWTSGGLNGACERRNYGPGSTLRLKQAF